MKAITLLLLFIITLSGCVTTGTTHSQTDFSQISPRQAVYYRAILKWQDRLDHKSFQDFDSPHLTAMRVHVKKYGWSNEAVAILIEESRKLTSLTMETEDHWDTPKEFVEKNYQGDCEDIAIFLLATLKKLDYPGQVRICAVKTRFVEHAMLKIQMPDSNWKIFETVKTTEKNSRFAYTPIVEFDDREIIFATI